MSYPGKIGLVLTGIFIWLSSSSFQTSYKKPDYSEFPLFIINRSRDANEIWYSINSNRNGEIDAKKPIRAFWVKKEKNNRIEPLTWIQKNYAYGIKVISIDSENLNSWKFQFVSYSKRSFILKKKESQFRVYTTSNGQEIEVTRIFVQIDGGSFWVPSVPFVKLTGVNPETGEILSEIIRP
jgi:hypothetical protein